jgi:hypothetical protein
MNTRFYTSPSSYIKFRETRIIVRNILVYLRSDDVLWSKYKPDTWNKNGLLTWNASFEYN